jgi:hypothetical protein
VDANRSTLGVGRVREAAMGAPRARGAERGRMVRVLKSACQCLVFDGWLQYEWWMESSELKNAKIGGREE